jgi:hypothetical protein
MYGLAGVQQHGSLADPGAALRNLEICKSWSRNNVATSCPLIHRLVALVGRVFLGLSLDALVLRSLALSELSSRKLLYPLPHESDSYFTNTETVPQERTYITRILLIRNRGSPYLDAVGQMRWPHERVRPNVPQAQPDGEWRRGNRRHDGAVENAFLSYAYGI